MTSTVPAEHVLTSDDRCPCGQPQEGSGYCSYECYSKHEPEPTSPASMGGPLSEADRIAEIRARSEKAKMVTANAAKTFWHLLAEDSEFLLRHVDKLETQLRNSQQCALRELQAQVRADEAEAERDAATSRVGVLEGQLATARALHKPDRRYSPDDGETSYATYSEAADASFDGVGTPRSVTFFEVCSHCASIEMAEGCDHQYKESLWPCKDAVALGLDGGGSDAE